MRSRTEKSQPLTRTKESQASSSTEKSQPLTRTKESQASSSTEKSQPLIRTDESQASSRKERSESNINRSQSVRSQIQNFQLTNLSAEFGANLEEELSLSEIFEKADSKDFPKKSFLIDGKLKSYTWILNFFTSIRIITESASKKNIEFTCKFCKMRNLSGFPDFTNLYKHLRIHNAYRKYGKLYQNKKGLTNPLVSHKQMIFIQYICSSSVALSEVSIIAPQTSTSTLSATSDNFFPLLQSIFNETETENSTNTSNPECTAYILERELDAEILNFTEIISE